MANNPTVLAGRAIASTLVQRYTFYPLIVITALLLLLLTISGALTIQHSLWWILLFISTFCWFILALLLLAISFVVFTKIRPRKLKTSELIQISKFVKNFEAQHTVTYGLKKNPTALASIIAWRFFKSKGKSSVVEVITEPVAGIESLKNQFNEIVKLFT